jgi:hypothetical protein
MSIPNSPDIPPEPSSTNPFRPGIPVGLRNPCNPVIPPSFSAAFPPVTQPDPKNPTIPTGFFATYQASTSSGSGLRSLLPSFLNSTYNIAPLQPPVLRPLEYCYLPTVHDLESTLAQVTGKVNKRNRNERFIKEICEAVLGSPGANDCKATNHRPGGVVTVTGRGAIATSGFGYYVRSVSFILFLL